MIDPKYETWLVALLKAETDRPDMLPLQVFLGEEDLVFLMMEQFHIKESWAKELLREIAKKNSHIERKRMECEDGSNPPIVWKEFDYRWIAKPEPQVIGVEGNLLPDS